MTVKQIFTVAIQILQFVLVCYSVEAISASHA